MPSRFGTIRIARCALLCATALLVACATTPPPSATQEGAPADAQQAYDRGAYRQAARLWQQQALDASPPEDSRLRLLAANAWLAAGEDDATEDLIPWIDKQSLSAPNAALLSLVLAELALDQHRPVEAQHHLELVGTALPGIYANRYADLAKRVQDAVGAFSTQSVQQAGEMAREITAYDTESALRLMKQLENVPSSQLAYLAEGKGDPQRSAWFDLALVLRRNLVNGANLESQVNEWKARHPNFAVSTSEALDLWLGYRQEFRHPANVAILLPDSGGLKAFGKAIRDGIMSAYLQQSSDSQIHFFGTGGDAPSVLAAYFEAADRGADWIIGPLDRASVEALLNLAGLATPVLALNDLPDSKLLAEGLSQQVFGISLSQEQEAAAVAQHMASMGYSNAVLLAPENTWGERIARAFQADFLQDNRQILVSSRYLPEENDHSQVLERALQIDESNARKKLLEDRLGIELEFEAVRRGDVDAIFLAAAPEQGRLLAPQLRFFEAGDIPTFATSRVYTGRPDPARNQDLDGLTVPLTVWQVQHPTQDSIPKLESLRQGEFAPFFAIGMDAWNILPWLKLMQSDPDFRFPGQAGTFSFSQTGNLQREPDWARFSRGIPIAATDQAAHPAPKSEGQ